MKIAHGAPTALWKVLLLELRGWKVLIKGTAT
jgi:hypothetical protein